MATDLEKLVVQLSADIKGYERGVRQAMGVTNRQAQAIEGRFRKMNRNLDGIGRGAARSLIAPLAGISAALSVREVARYADAWTAAGNKLRASAQISGMQARGLEDLNALANETRSGISQTVDLYSKLLRSASGVARSEEEIARATKTVNLAFKAGGAAASEQAAGILQLSQGLASGMLQGDELRSVRENAPVLAQAIADFYGVTITGLKKLGEEGKLTSDQVFRAILAAQPRIEAAFAKTNSTIADGITRVNNAFTQYIGQSDSGLSATQRLVAGLTALADNFDTVADTTLKVAAIIAGALVGRSIAGMVARLGLATVAVTQFVAAARAAVTMTGLAAAIGGVTAAAGPLGLILGGAAVAAMVLFSGASDSAGTASDRFRERMQKLGDQSGEAAGEVEKAADRIELAAKRVEEARKRLAGLNAEEAEAARLTEHLNMRFEELLTSAIAVGKVTLVSPKQIGELESLLGKLRAGELNAENIRGALERLENGSGYFSGLIADIRLVGDELARVLGAAIALRAEVAETRTAADDTPGRAAMRRYGTSRTEDVRRQDENATYVAEQRRLNSLTKDQLDLEREINRIKSERPQLSANEIEALARETLAAEAARRKTRGGGGGGAIEGFDDAILKEIAGMEAETAALNSLTSAQIGYGNAVERARREAELLQALQNKGISVTPELRAQVSKLADEWQRAADANKQANDRLSQMERIGESVSDSLRSAFDGIFDDPKRALEDLAKQLAMLALKMQLVRLFPGVFGAGGVVPLLAANGGLVRGPGTGTSDSVPARLSNGEFVVNARATAKHRELLGAINSGRAVRMAAGGYVGVPRIPSVSRGGGGMDVQIIDQRGANTPPIETQQRRGPNGREMLVAVVKEEWSRGTFDRAVQGRQGIKPQKLVR